MFTDPTQAAFKTRFARDFAYGTTEDTVKDVDLTNAFTDVGVMIPKGLFPSQEIYTQAFLYLAAHRLVENLKAATAGWDGNYSWFLAAQSADGVAASYEIPDWVKSSRTLSPLATTRYGQTYISLLSPRLTGAMFSVPRRTNP